MPRPLNSLLSIWRKPVLASHRGYGKLGPVPENTWDAFARSTAEGFKAHELDVRRTKDNVAVLFHGPKLENTTNGHGRIEETLFSEIIKLNFAAYLPEHPPTRVTTLVDYLQNIGGDVLTNIELKRDRWDFSRGLEEAVVAAVETTQSSSRIFYSSFNWYCLWRLKKLAPHSGIGLLLEPGHFFWLRDFIGRILLKPDLIHPHYTMATAQRIKKYKKKGYAIALWTVNEEEQIKNFFAHGVDIIITDRINLIKKFSSFS